MNARASALPRLAGRLLLAGLAGGVASRAADAPPSSPATAKPATPVILIPGFMGSKLADEKDGRLVWGKLLDITALTAHEAVFESDRDGLELPIDSTDFTANRDRIKPAGILDRFTVIPHVAGVNVYRKTLRTLESRCGYTRGNIETCELGTDLYVFDYDWRRDLVESARLLAQRIRHIREASGNSEQRVTVIAHSMGGLVALYYVLYGDRDVLGEESPQPDYAGLASIEHLYLIAPPLGGAVNALRYLQEGYGHSGWRIGPYAAFTMPSVYEMLPSDPAGLFVDPSLKPVRLDLYDPENWRRHGLGVYARDFRRRFLIACKRLYRDQWREKSAWEYDRLDRYLAAALVRARAFHLALAAADPERLEGRIEVIGSEDRATPARVILDEAPSAVELDFTGRAHAGLSGGKLAEALTSRGDGTVTRDSLRAGGLVAAPRLVSGAHLDLPTRPEVLDYLTVQLGIRVKTDR